MPAAPSIDRRSRLVLAAVMALGWLVVDLAFGPDRQFLEHLATAVAFGVVVVVVLPFLVRKADQRDQLD